jgi:hypothetical protein
MTGVGVFFMTMIFILQDNSSVAIIPAIHPRMNTEQSGLPGNLFFFFLCAHSGFVKVHL